MAKFYCISMNSIDLIKDFTWSPTEFKSQMLCSVVFTNICIPNYTCIWKNELKYSNARERLHTGSHAATCKHVTVQMQYLPEICSRYCGLVAKESLAIWPPALFSCHAPGMYSKIAAIASCNPWLIGKSTHWPAIVPSHDQKHLTKSALTRIIHGPVTLKLEIARPNNVLRNICHLPTIEVSE